MGHGDDALNDTNRSNLREVVRYLEKSAMKDDAEFAATGDRQKLALAAEKRARASTIRTLLALRAEGVSD
jgi:hypothetical protein